MTDTHQRRLVLYRDRWSSLSLNDAILDISNKLTASQLKAHELFRDYPEKFLEKISPDVAVVTWKEGAILFEEGNYIDLAFFVISGEVQVTLLAGSSVGKGWREPASVDIRGSTTGEGTVMLNLVTLSRKMASKSSHKEIRLLSTMDFDLPENTGALLGPGELFGELGALSGWPQPVTARTTEETILLQIRLPALRLMKNKSPQLKARLDKLYRERSLLSQLRSTALLQKLPEEFLEQLTEKVELVSLGPGEALANQGEAMDAIYLVRSGFIKLSQRFGTGDLVVSYLSKGQIFGSEMMLPELQGWESTAMSVEYAELIRIPTPVCTEIMELEPEISEWLWREAGRTIKETGYSKRHLSHAQFTETALDLGLVQGNSMLVIDLERCTRCDDCVRACAATHGGRPRFIREGNRLGNLLIPKSCFHCHDPVCLVGCPTGAIHRAGDSEVIEVDGDICIGCATCANNCPYDAIVMHDMNETWPEDMIPSALRGTPRHQASKCDLCHEHGGEPACVVNCPQGCAERITSIDSLKHVFERD